MSGASMVESLDNQPAEWMARKKVDCWDACWVVWLAAKSAAEMVAYWVSCLVDYWVDTMVVKWECVMVAKSAAWTAVE